MSAKAEARFPNGGNRKKNKKKKNPTLTTPEQAVLFKRSVYWRLRISIPSGSPPHAPPHISYFQKVIGEEGKQRPPKTYGKLRTWSFANRLPPPPAHELLVVNEKAARQLQEHTKRVERPARGTCEPSGFGKVLSPGRVPETPPPLSGVPPHARPAATGGAQLTFVSLTFWSLREEGTSPSSKSSEKKTERGKRLMRAGTERGRKEQA